MKEQWDISRLKEWDKNPRGIEKGDFVRLKKQIKKLGQYKPLLVTKEGVVLGGNMRLKAFKELGVDKVWVSVVDPKSEDEMIEYALSDNDRAGYYEDQALAELLQGSKINLDDYKVDLGRLTSLADVLSRFGPDPVEDEAPPLGQGDPDSKLGEVYELGKHRLMCGDATSIKDVEKLMDGKKADMVFTDPPYNVDYSGEGKETKVKIKNDDLSESEFREFLQDCFSNYAMVLKRSTGFYCCYASRTHREFEDSLNNSGFEVINQIIWVKKVASMGWGNYRWKHEPILYCKLGGGKPEFYGDRKQYTVWDHNPDDTDMVKWLVSQVEKDESGGSTVWRLGRDFKYQHPTQKPVQLVWYALRNSSKTEDIVLDLFGGSGSTLIACEQTNRRCYMMELDPRYCDVIRKRYENITAK